MAEKRKKQTAVFGTNQPRDENRAFGHDVQRSEQKQKSGKNKRKTGQYRKEDTFGQRDQKSGNTDTSKNQKSDFSQENNAFTEENVSEQEKSQPQDDYHRRDTYHQSEKKGKYRRREYQDRQRTRTSDFEHDFQTKDSTFTESERTEFEGSKKLDRLQKKAEKAGRKTEAARKKIPKKTEYSLERVFDEKTGRAKYVLTADKKEKQFKPDNPVKVITGRAGAEVSNFTHGKVAGVEKENSGVEGAHKTEQKAEDVYHFVKRHHKSRLQKQHEKVKKLEKKQFQKEVKFRYQKFLEENPQMQEKTLKKQIQRHLQKQRIKREYAKARRAGQAAKNTKEAAANTASFTTTVAKKVQELAAKHAGLLVANHIFFFFRDGIGEMPEELELKLSNYPDAHSRLVELLSTPEGVELVASDMDKALQQIESGEKEFRFRSVISKEELRAELDNLLLEKQTFPTSDNVEIKKEDFITQDKIDHRLGRGSGFAHGSFRIYDYFKEGHDSKEAVAFLKNEYGTGGSSPALVGTDRSNENHDAKGIKLEKGSIMEPYTEVLLSWNVVEKRIRKLIEEDRYLSPEGKEAYAAYKEDEARKAMQKAQEKMERDTKVSCKEAIEKAIAEKFDGYRLPKETAEDVIREYGSERVAYVLANTVMHLSHDGRFSPDNKEWAKEIEPYAMIENRDLIVTSHPAVLNGFINQTRRYIEHEKKLAAQAAEENTVTIDGQNCIQVDEWKSGEDTYLLGNATEDSGFYYAEVNGDTHIEYDHKEADGKRCSRE